MNGLHQKLKIHRDALAQRRARLESGELTPVEAHDLEGVIAEIEGEVAFMEASAIWGEEAFAQISKAFGLLDHVSYAGRELSLAITAFETGLWRLRNHLGTPTGPEPTVQAD